METLICLCPETMAVVDPFAFANVARNRWREFLGNDKSDEGGIQVGRDVAKKFIAREGNLSSAAK